MATNKKLPTSTNRKNVDSLLRKVEQGDPSAAVELLRGAHLLCSAVTRICTKHPEMLHAGWVKEWPAIVRRADAAKDSALEKYLTAIHLAEASHLARYYGPPKGKRQRDPNSTQNRVAEEMLRFMRAGIRAAGNGEPNGNAFKNLPSLSKRSWPDWFAIAYRALEIKYGGDVLNDPALAALGKGASENYIRAFNARSIRNRNRGAAGTEIGDVYRQSQMAKRKAATEVAAAKKARASIRSQLQEAFRDIGIGK